ncbi:MAG: M28 family peptidase [Dehalococcoidia bacterium]
MLGVGEPRLRPLDPRLVTATARMLEAVRVERLRDGVAALAEPRGRLHAPEAMARADGLILDRFRAAGWSAEARPFTLRDAAGNLDHGGYRPTVYPELHGVNIVAVKPGESSDALVVGAHHDTVPGSPGADDNGAGVAALLELARVLAPARFRRSIVLAALDMEEIGLLGTRALLPSLVAERSVHGAVIFESIGYTATAPGSQTVPQGMDLLYRGQMARLRRRGVAGDFTALIYNGRSRQLARALGEGLAYAAGRDAVLLLRDPKDIPGIGRLLTRAVPAVRNFARSDHAVFWRAGIPAVLMTDTANFRNPHYHRPTDTPETLDYERVAAIVRATVLLLVRAAGLVDSPGKRSGTGISPIGGTTS